MVGRKRKSRVRKKRVRMKRVKNWSRSKDAKLSAKKPGKRVSANGNVYYEYRVNRADKKGRAKKGKRL